MRVVHEVLCDACGKRAEYPNGSHRWLPPATWIVVELRAPLETLAFCTPGCVALWADWKKK
jgi:hypothetical protein